MTIAILHFSVIQIPIVMKISHHNPLNIVVNPIPIVPNRATSRIKCQKNLSQAGDAKSDIERSTDITPENNPQKRSREGFTNFEFPRFGGQRVITMNNHQKMFQANWSYG